jgi:hypothetical protein
MKISHKLITLGLAISLLASTSAFAKPSPHFEKGFPSYEKSTGVGHVPTARTSRAPGYPRRPSPNADRDGWPADMILG